MTKINPVVVHDVSETLQMKFDEDAWVFWMGFLAGICAGMVIVMILWNLV